ncbi:MAG: cation:proton antiporter [Prolixibacteraceae bacterium]|nr:cation:proton antiporter [Prolixibacteraceae bacterium]
MTDIINIALPLTDPVYKFFLLLVIMLFAPIILNKFKIPHLLGLIIAGAIIGPYGVNLVSRDSGIVLSGTVGLLYIMFLAGIEINMADFKKNAIKSTFLGLTGFFIPMILGTLAGYYMLNYSLITSVLLASMFASHTLITYPMVSKLGIAKNKAVNITVGSTLITNILALLVLAIVVGMSTDNIDQYFWIRLSLLFIIFTLVTLFVFPLIARWFFKRYADSISQYIFVLVMMFLGAVLFQLAGIEAIIGAFLSGLALNRLIPRTSPLMNRIDFVGNSIFIPFFLISVGMLINFQAFISDIETIVVAITMSVLATVGKYIPAWLTQKSFGYSIDERRVIFGLSNAQAAATLAAVLVGYNIIVGVDANGNDIRLLNDSILNGTIIMILVTCTIASFATQKGAQNIAAAENVKIDDDDDDKMDKILIPVNNPETLDELVGLGVIIQNSGQKYGLYGLNIIQNDTKNLLSEQNARKLLDKAAVIASSTDNHLTKILRYDLSVVHAITSVIKEHNISNLVMGLHIKKGITESFLGSLTEGILAKNNITTFVYKAAQPISTLKKQIVILPIHAEREVGFPFLLFKIWNIAVNSGAKLHFYGHENTINFIKEIHSKNPIDADFGIFEDWDDFLILSREIKPNDGLIIVMSRERKISFQNNMRNVPKYLNKYFSENSFILIYPMQYGVTDDDTDLYNPSILQPLEKIDELGKSIVALFRKK